MDVLVFILLIAIISAVVMSVKATFLLNKKKRMEEKLLNLNGFTPSQKIFGADGNSGIAIDESRKKVCLIKQSNGNVKLDVLAYKDILSSEIFEDGVSITKTDRGSQLGGAIIGGLALGGAGAIIGGLSGKKTSSEKVKRIDLRITVNRTSNPIHDINFMYTEEKKNGKMYNDAMKLARHWHGLMTVLIKRAASECIVKESEPVEEKTKLSQKSSVIDDLVKLAELHKQGLLTDEEFKTQKAKLLR